MTEKREEALRVETDGRGVRRLTIARPKKRNAFDDALIAELTAAIEDATADAAVRVLALTGSGGVFSAGADLDWMREAAERDFQGNLEDALRLARLMRTLDEAPKPTVAVVNGPAVGGGVGLVAACDVALAASSAFLQLSEVALGIVPAVIAPYVLRAVGERQGRRLFLTAERVPAERAAALGLVHEAVPDVELEARAEKVVARLLAGGPAAMARAKLLCRELREVPGERVDELTARTIAELRASEEGREGIGAFLAKREPSWRGGAA